MSRYSLNDSTSTRTYFESVIKVSKGPVCRRGADVYCTLYRSRLEFAGEDSCAEVGVVTDAFQQRSSVHVDDDIRDADVDEVEVDTVEDRRRTRTS